MNKYDLHLPFYRQQKIFSSHQLSLSDHTMAGWAMGAAEALAPLGEAMWRLCTSVEVLQADETPVKVLKPEKKAYMWVYHCYLPGTRFVLFDFHLSRSGDVVAERLNGFKGLLQADGYSGYNKLCSRDDITRIGCWDHARRKFAEVVKISGGNKSGKAGEMLKKIGKLYEIEADIKDLSYEDRYAIRQKASKPKLQVIRSFLDKINASPNTIDKKLLE